MTLRHLLDTNFCIRVPRDRPPSLRERFNNEADGLCISTIVLAELPHGAATSARPDHHRREVDRFVSRLEVLGADRDAMTLVSSSQPLKALYRDRRRALASGRDHPGSGPQGT